MSSLQHLLCSVWIVAKIRSTMHGKLCKRWHLQRQASSTLASRTRQIIAALLRLCSLSCQDQQPVLQSCERSSQAVQHVETFLVANRTCPQACLKVCNCCLLRVLAKCQDRQESYSRRLLAQAQLPSWYKNATSCLSTFVLQACWIHVYNRLAFQICV